MPKRYLIFFLPLLLCYRLAFGQTYDLAYYIQSGLQNSPLLQDYTYQQQSNLIDSLKVYASYKPQVNAVANAMEAPIARPFGYDEAVSNGGDYSAVVRGTQPLFQNRFRQADVANIRLLNKSLGAQRQIAAQDLKRVITAQYITAYADYRQMQYSQQVLDLLQTEQPALRRLVQNGVYLQTDYLNLTINIQTQAIAHRQARIQYQFDLNGLRMLCGIIDTGLVDLAKPELEVTALIAASLTPTLQKFRIDSLQLSLNRTLVDLNYRYRVVGYADAGVMATTPQDVPRHLGASVGISLSFPIYDGGQRRLEYQKLALAEQSREKYRDFYLRQYRMQQLQLRAQLASTDLLIQDMEEQLRSQQKLLDMYKLEIAAGMVRFTDYILVISNYAQTQQNLVQAEIGRFQIVNEFNNLP